MKNKGSKTNDFGFHFFQWYMQIKLLQCHACRCIIVIYQASVAQIVGDDHLDSEIMFARVCTKNLKYSTRLKDRTRTCFQISVYDIVGEV